MVEHPQARQFLRRLDPEAKAFTFQTFDDVKGRKKRELARVIHGDFDGPTVAMLDTFQNQHAGVFVTINETDGKGRQAHNITRVRAVFVDLDGAPLQPVLTAALEPHIVCESSPGRFHAYWLTDDCPLDRFDCAQLAMAQRFGGDTSVTDVSRVMRMPGFRHFKEGEHLSKMLDVGFSGPPYALSEIVATLQLDLSTQKKTKPNGHAGKIQEGNGRHDHLFQVGRSAALRCSREAVRAALMAENQACCDPPVADADIEYLVGRAFDAKHATSWRPPEERPTEERPQLLRNDNGLILPCEHNAFVLIEAAPEYATLHFDEFLSRPRIGERDWNDDDDLVVVRWLQSSHGVARFNLGQARNAARSVAHMRKRDSLREFVESLPAWDGTPRIEHAFTEAWGAPDSEVIQAASRNFFVALIARALHPGAQVDTLWTFEGPQGILKSASLRALGGGFHHEISANVGSTDFQRELRGVWLAEMSELDSLRGREASTIKRLLSAPSDRFVQKYELHAKSYPRRAVAVATTNEANYWQDSTGARRLIPIPCGEIRVDLIAINTRQWFAEARQLHASGAKWWEFPGIEGEQEERQQVDPWEDALRDYIAHGKRGAGFGGVDLTWPAGDIPSAVIMRDWLRLEASQQGQASSTRLGRVMRRIGFVPVRIGHEQARGWRRADT